MEFFFDLEKRADPVGWEHRADIATASRGDLLWFFFPSSVGIRTDGVELATTFEWVPVLHFALSMFHVCRTLTEEATAEARYIFTEADEWLQFRRRDDTVMIESSFSPVVMSCTLDELRRAVKDFGSTVISRLCSSYPALSRTDLVREMVALSDSL
jgi:hypothetical protein